MSLFLGNTQIGGVATGDAATIENLNPEISTQDNLIAQIMGALEGKIAPPDLSAKVSELEAEVENLEETNSNLSS